MKWQWQDDELHSYWFITEDERQLIHKKTNHGRLGFIILLKFFQTEGYFPLSQKEIPPAVKNYLATQLDVDSSRLLQYEWQGSTGKRDKADILKFLGIRRAKKSDLVEFSKILTTEILPFEPVFNSLQEFAFSWFKDQKIEAPSSAVLERLIKSTIAKFDSYLNAHISNNLNDTTKSVIDQFVLTEETKLDNKAEKHIYSWLREDKGNANLDSFLQIIEKISVLRKLALSDQLFTTIPTKWLERYSRRAATESIWELRRHQKDLRYVLVASFCWQRQMQLTDNLIEAFIQITHKIG